VSKAIDERGGADAELTQEVAEALKEAREKRGITKTEADEMFCGGTTNYSWFEGRPDGTRLPPDDTFAEICAEWSELKEYKEEIKTANREGTGEIKRSGIGQAFGEDGWESGTDEVEITAPATSEAEEWDGFKTALKPATEYVVVARAPLGEGTVAENVMEWGTGALNIDGCRIGLNGEDNPTGSGKAPEDSEFGEHEFGNGGEGYETPDKGRYPANVAFDEAAARELNRQSGVSKGGDFTGLSESELYGDKNHESRVGEGYDDEGAASRFFYTSKASKSERNLGLPDDEDNEHPTVKPIDLMRWLVQLVTAEGQVVVDPFAGSGTTLLAADFLGREWVGIEKDEEHAELARRRINNYDASEVKEWIDDESVTEARQETLDALTQADGGGSE
jgi:hypothetical protein